MAKVPNLPSNLNNSDNQAGKVAGIAVAAAASSSAMAFGAGYGGAAAFDTVNAPVEVSPDEDIVVEEDVDVAYEYDNADETLAPEPITEPLFVVPSIGDSINDVAVIITPGDDNLPIDDPDEVTDAIIAEEMVDPTDIDSVTVVEFTAMGTRYDADGNEQTVAYFHNNRTDSDMMLVDNNNDGTFDYVADTNGNYYADSVGAVFTVDDVEAQLSDGTYLAATETPETVLDNGDSFLNDIITV